jgi:CRISPR-associated protein Cmr3
MMSTDVSTTIGLLLEPLDVLFFRDGRPFTASERLLSGLPLPQTLAGAIRTALLQQVGCDFSRMRGAATFAEAVARSCGSDDQWIARTTIRGPWLARRTAADEGIDVLVPMPATLQQAKRAEHQSLHRIAPLTANELPGWNPTGDQAGLRPLWLKTLDSTEPATGFLTQNGLRQFLASEPVMASEVVKTDELYSLDHRTGIGISPDRLVAEESQIYGRGFLALQENVAIYAEVVLPDDAPPDGRFFDDLRTLSIGGEGRHATIRQLPHPVAWPQTAPTEGRKPLVLLTTPCPFKAGWKPQTLAQQIIAAAVPGSIPFSGWDLANRCPKPTRFAVPAGSVYFLNSLPEKEPHSLAETEDERQLGWGCCLTGVWTDD